MPVFFNYFLVFLKVNSGFFLQNRVATLNRVISSLYQEFFLSWQTLRCTSFINLSELNAVTRATCGLWASFWAACQVVGPAHASNLVNIFLNIKHWKCNSIMFWKAIFIKHTIKYQQIVYVSAWSVDGQWLLSMNWI